MGRREAATIPPAIPKPSQIPAWPRTLPRTQGQPQLLRRPRFSHNAKKNWEKEGKFKTKQLQEFKITQSVLSRLEKGWRRSQGFPCPKAPIPNSSEGAASGILRDLKAGSSLAPPPLHENSPFPAASPGPRSEDLSHGKLEQLPRESWRIPAREKSRIPARRTGGRILGRRSDPHHLALPRIPDLAWEPARLCLEFLGNSPFFSLFFSIPTFTMEIWGFPSSRFHFQRVGIGQARGFSGQIGFSWLC